MGIRRQRPGRGVNRGGRGLGRGLGTCGGIPRQDGSGGGVGNIGTPRQPKKKIKLTNVKKK